MFNGCASLSSLPDISKWNTNNVTDMSYMFFGCSSLSSLPDISKWNINNVNNLSYMFHGCSSLSSLPDILEWIFYGTNVNCIFDECENLIIYKSILFLIECKEVNSMIDLDFRPS